MATRGRTVLIKGHKVIWQERREVGCECGWTSGPQPSNFSAQQAHRDHKLEVRDE